MLACPAELMDMNQDPVDDPKRQSDPAPVVSGSPCQVVSGKRGIDWRSLISRLCG